MQKSDGAWPADSLYHLGTASRYFGSEIMSTVFAAQALIESEKAVWKGFSRGFILRIGRSFTFTNNLSSASLVVFFRRKPQWLAPNI